MTEPHVHPDADAELLDAVRSYELTSRGLGAEFDEAVAHAVDDLVAFAHQSRRPGYWTERVAD